MKLKRNQVRIGMQVPPLGNDQTHGVVTAKHCSGYDVSYFQGKSKVDEMYCYFSDNQ